MSHRRAGHMPDEQSEQPEPEQQQPEQPQQLPEPEQQLPARTPAAARARTRAQNGDKHCPGAKDPLTRGNHYG